MTSVIYGENEIRNLSGSLLRKSIVQVLFNADLIISSFQDFVTMAKTLIPISADHSPVLFSLSKGKDCLRGK